MNYRRVVGSVGLFVSFYPEVSRRYHPQSEIPQGKPQRHAMGAEVVNPMSPFGRTVGVGTAREMWLSRATRLRRCARNNSAFTMRREHMEPNSSYAAISLLAAFREPRNKAKLADPRTTDSSASPCAKSLFVT